MTIVTEVSGPSVVIAPRNETEPRSLTAPLALTPEHVALRAMERFIQDEYEFVLATYRATVDTYGDAAQMAVYVARQFQLHAAAVVERLTGKPMPTGTVRHPWAEDPDNPDENDPFREQYPDLPPVGGAQ